MFVFREAEIYMLDVAAPPRRHPLGTMGSVALYERSGLKITIC